MSATDYVAFGLLGIAPLLTTGLIVAALLAFLRRYLTDRRLLLAFGLGLLIGVLGGSITVGFAWLGQTHGIILG